MDFKVGEVVALPGADGYTMCVFTASDVPVGTSVYVKKTEEELPWYPPEDPDYGPWIELFPRARPRGEFRLCQILLRDEREIHWFYDACLPPDDVNWEGGDIVAYRILK